MYPRQPLQERKITATEHSKTDHSERAGRRQTANGHAIWLRVRMDAVHEIVYPAIAKAQQLSAERLGVRVPEHATRWDIRRPPQTSYGDNGEDVRRLGRQASSGRRREPQQITVDNVAAAMRSSLSMLQPSPSPPTRRGVGDLPVVRRDKPAAVSPLPPRHDRPSQRTVLVDITQV